MAEKESEPCVGCGKHVHPDQHPDGGTYDLVRDGVRGSGGAYCIPCGVVEGIQSAIRIYDAHVHDIAREKGLVTEVYAGTSAFAEACSRVEHMDNASTQLVAEVNAQVTKKGRKLPKRADGKPVRPVNNFNY